MLSVKRSATYVLAGLILLFSHSVFAAPCASYTAITYNGATTTDTYFTSASTNMAFGKVESVFFGLSTAIVYFSTITYGTAMTCKSVTYTTSYTFPGSSSSAQNDAFIIDLNKAAQLAMLLDYTLIFGVASGGGNVSFSGYTQLVNLN